MSTPILALTSDHVKEAGNYKIQSGKLAELLKQTDYHSLKLPPNLTAQAYLISHLPPSVLPTGVIWFIPTHRDLVTAQTLLNFWLNTNDLTASNTAAVLTFPQDFAAWYQNLSQKKPSILILAHEHLPLALPSRQWLQENTIILTVNQKIKPVELLTKLEAVGFEPGPLPDNTGWWQKIGGSLIINTNQGSWRLNWNNDVIESIEAIKIESGVTKNKLQQITILPHRWLANANTTVANYIDNQLLIAAPQEFLSKTNKRINIDLLKSKKFFGSVPMFAKQWPEINNWLKQTKEVTVILTQSPYKLSRTTTNQQPTPIIVEVPAITAAALSGFTDLITKTNYLTDREIFGALRQPQSRRLASFEKLKLHDYLVHIDHGIGKFGGLVQKKYNDGAREYFLVEYAAGDKLYVPIEHTDRLSRYLGTPHPTLERLSSAHWFQVQKKIKVETAALARELLNLYAKRHLAKTKVWQNYPEEDLLAASFPYPLTSDQLKTWAEIDADLSGTKPMDRLLCGDVGFGKTELAIRAAARAAFNGYQTAVLAPTTILTQQHFDTFTTRLSAYGIKIGLISRAQTSSQINRTLKSLASNEIDIIIGTHRLLGRDVSFHNLGLLIIDEEQRFGVKQKEKIRSLTPSVHTLALSATPIPRTLNLAVSNLRDLSIILSPPAGRKSTQLIFSERTDQIIKQALTTELKRRGQIYYLVPHIKDLPAAELRLKNTWPKIKIGIIHGRKSPSQVADIMRRFDAGELELLLATSIIEHGLDLPKVNTLIVENAHTFGLADLYQLKGRVGRGSVQAYAYFLTAKQTTVEAQKRFAALADTTELGGGLSLALKDLELRGAGAILGRQQHGQISAVGLHLYSQMLTDAIEEQRTGQTLPLIPEVRLNLPLDGRLSPELIVNEEQRIHLYQRLASIREPSDLLTTAEELIGRPLMDSTADRLLKNLLTTLEIKLLAEKARLQEITCYQKNSYGQFSIRFLDKPDDNVLSRLTDFDDSWHRVETSWQANHPLAAGAWIPWLKQSLKLLQN